MGTIKEGSHIACGTVYKLRADGKCMVVHCPSDFSSKARIRCLQDDGRWVTVGYYADLAHAMNDYYVNYDR